MAMAMPQSDIFLFLTSD